MGRKSGKATALGCLELVALFEDEGPNAGVRRSAHSRRSSRARRASGCGCRRWRSTPAPQLVVGRVVDRRIGPTNSVILRSSVSAPSAIWRSFYLLWLRHARTLGSEPAASGNPRVVRQQALR